MQIRSDYRKRTFECQRLKWYLITSQNCLYWLSSMLGGMNSHERKRIFTFTILEIEAIISYLDDMRIQVTEAEINKPTASTVQSIFEGILDVFFEHTHWHNSCSIPADFSCENQELLYDSVNLIYFNRMVSGLVMKAGVKDYSLRDIIRPGAARLRSSCRLSSI